MDYEYNDKTLGFFRSKARSKILLNFFINPEKEFYTRELERQLKIPASNVRRELKKIEASGLIDSRDFGNLLLYKINKENPLYLQLRDLIVKNLGIREFFRPHFEKEENVAFSFIYGSYARGEFDPASDIDIFVVTRKNSSYYEKLNGRLSLLEKTFGREINADVITLREYQQKKADNDPYVTDILRNEKIFIKGGENDI